MLNREARERRLMSCLGDPSRFQLVTMLLRGARCVSDLAQDVGLSQSCTTRHLQALQRERVVLGKRDGKRVLFRLRLDDSEVRALVAWAISERGVRRGTRTSPRGSRPHGGDVHSDGARVYAFPSAAGPRLKKRPPRPRRRPAGGATKADIRLSETPGPPPAERSIPGRDGHVEPEASPPRRPIRQELEDFLL